MHPQRPAFTSSIPENTSCFRNRNATKFLHRNIICVTSLNNLQKISISHRLLINRKHFHFHLRLTNHEHPAADPVWAPKTPPNLHPHTSKRPSLPEKPCTPPLTASAIGLQTNRILLHINSSTRPQIPRPFLWKQSRKQAARLSIYARRAGNKHPPRSD